MPRVDVWCDHSITNMCCPNEGSYYYETKWTNIEYPLKYLGQYHVNFLYLEYPKLSKIYDSNKSQDANIYWCHGDTESFSTLSNKICTRKYNKILVLPTTTTR